MQVNYVSSRIDNIANMASKTVLSLSLLVGLLIALPASLITIPLIVLLSIFIGTKIHSEFKNWQCEYYALPVCDKGRVESLIAKHHLKSLFYILPLKFLIISIIFSEALSFIHQILTSPAIH